jgi:hypothetical protein
MIFLIDIIPANPITNNKFQITYNPRGVSRSNDRMSTDAAFKPKILGFVCHW